jgi:hypothetical protein
MTHKKKTGMKSWKKASSLLLKATSLSWKEEDI